MMAKGLSSASSISAIVMSDDIYNGIVRGSDQVGHYFAHGATYAGHPLPQLWRSKCSTSSNGELLAHIREVAKHFAARLHGYAQHPLVGEVRQIDRWRRGTRGKQGEARILPPTWPGRAASETALRSARPDRARGAGGRFDRILSPLITTAAEIDEIFGRFDIAIEETTRWAEEQRLVRFE